jgi:hypothetical protein
VDALVVHHIGARVQAGDVLLDPQVELVYRRILQVRIDDVDARCAGTRQHEA